MGPSPTISLSKSITSEARSARVTTTRSSEITRADHLFDLDAQFVLIAGQRRRVALEFAQQFLLNPFSQLRVGQRLAARPLGLLALERDERIAR